MTIPLIDTISRQNDGNFALMESTDIYGGWMTVADTTERDAIPSNVLRVGQHIWVVGDSELQRWNGATWDVVALGGAAIGDAVSGGTANRVLYIDGSGNLADNTNLEWTGSRLEIGSPESPEGVLDVNGDLTARRNVQPTTALDGFWYCGAPGRRWYSVWSYGGLRMDGSTGQTGLLGSNTGDTITLRASGNNIFNSYGGYYSGYSLTQWYSRWNNFPAGNSGGAFPAIRTFQTGDLGISQSAPQFLFSALGQNPTFANGVTIPIQGMFGIGKVGTAQGARLSVLSAGATQFDALSSFYIDNSPLPGVGVTVGTANTLGLYAMHVDAGVARFDGDGTYVFELPADAVDPTGGGGAATGRIPVYIFGVGLAYLAYWV